MIDNKNERWVPWITSPAIMKKYDVTNIADNGKKGFVITCIAESDINSQLLIIFKQNVWAYRSTDESLLWNTVSVLNHAYGTEFYKNQTLFKIEDSYYMEWIKRESCGAYESIKFTHFVIFGLNQMIDIIAPYEPIIKTKNITNKHE